MIENAAATRGPARSVSRAATLGRAGVAAIGRGLRHAAAWVLVLLARAYQFAVRPLMPSACRFTPNCSEYFIEAVSRHGPIRGGWLGLRRILRCRPGGGGGFDPVP